MPVTLENVMKLRANTPRIPKPHENLALLNRLLIRVHIRAAAFGRSLPVVNTVCTGQVECNAYPLTFRLRGCGAQSRVSEANGLNQLLCFCVEDKRIVSVFALVRLPELRKTELAKQVMHGGIIFTCSGKACLTSQ